MRRRTTPPPGLHSQSTEAVPLDGREPHHLRAPSRVRCGRLARLHEDTHSPYRDAKAAWDAAVAPVAEGDPPRAPAPGVGVALEQATERYLAALGAFVGLCWCHESIELDVPRPGPGASLLDYGWQVFEELIEAEYTEGEISLLGIAAVQLVVKRATGDFDRKVQAHKDF